MKPEEKMQKVVEAAGECWFHEPETRAEYCSKWSCCGASKILGSASHPSPTDLNELFRLAEKLGWVDIVTGETADGDCFADIINSDCEVMLGSTRNEALLNALYKAIS